MSGPNVAVLGATGVVGREMVKVLEQRGLPVERLALLASPRSAGSTLEFRGKSHRVEAVSRAGFDGIDIALFSAGAGVSREWAPIAAERGAVVIDNSSAWRMDDAVPLVVPEVNPGDANVRPKGIIANPNCSTIQMVVALAPLHRHQRIRRVIVATYQAISGSGASAVSAFEAQAKALLAGESTERGELRGQLARNLLMHWTPDAATGYQEEELKMVHETRKILGDAELRISPTAVRVPVVNAHAEALTLEFESPMSPALARSLLEGAPGVSVVDDFANGIYPQPIDASGTDPVYVGRIREDVGNPGGLQMWVVADNLRKGAALNAVQIAERLLG